MNRRSIGDHIETLSVPRPAVSVPGGAEMPGQGALAPSGSEPSPTHDAAARERFLREARAL